MWPPETKTRDEHIANTSLLNNTGATAMKKESRIKFSIVVPIFNEEGSAATLYVTLTQVMRSLGDPYEIVFVDDGSSDRSPAILEDIQEADSCVRVVTLRRNFGQTPALKAGFDTA